MKTIAKHMPKLLSALCYLALILSLLQMEYKQAAAWFCALNAWFCLWLKEDIDKMIQELKIIDEAIRIIKLREVKHLIKL